MLTPEEARSPATLRIGDPAPPIAVSEWLRGEPVPEFRPGIPTVLEFWAPWCGPCLGVAPKTSALAERLGERAIVIGIAGIDEWSSRATIRRCVERNAARMRYRIAIDQGTTTADRYRRAVRESGLPHAFVVDGDGRFAWHGHPAALEPVLTSMLAGTWDLARAAREQEERERAAIETRRATEAWFAASESGDREAQLALLEAICRHPIELVQGMSPAFWAWPARVRLLVAAERIEEACRVADEAVVLPGIADEPWAIAWIASELRQRALPEALRHAERAAALLRAIESAPAPADPWDAYLLEAGALQRGAAYGLVAAIAADAGRWEDAIALQERALELAVDDPRLGGNSAQRRATLEDYRAWSRAATSRATASD